MITKSRKKKHKLKHKKKLVKYEISKKKKEDKQ